MEQCYNQIDHEKEVLAETWACKQPGAYLIGTKFVVEMDLKPLDLSCHKELRRIASANKMILIKNYAASFLSQTCTQ